MTIAGCRSILGALEVCLVVDGRMRTIHVSRRWCFGKYEVLSRCEGDEYLPANFAEAVHGDYPFLPRTDLLRFALTLPGEHWSVYKIVLCLVRVEYRELSFSKSLLSRSDRRVIKGQPDEIDR